MFPLLILLPMALALAAIALSKNSMRLRYIAIAGSVASLLLLYLVQYGTNTITWFTVNSFAFNITTAIAPLNLLLLFVVLLMGSIILVYSSGFMETQSEQRRFYIEMLAFEIAMCAFAMSGNFILLFISWEFLSLFSYLLIGFWFNREKAVRASRLAITIVLIGDVALLAAIVIFFNIFGTLEFAGILAAIPSNISSGLYLGVILLIVAIFTKSAQFPFQEWLPDAMEGPTPVSAFLHSTTMVKAGVFVAIILFPLFLAVGVLPIIMAFAVITAILSTLNAMKETQIKRIIAYSTIQELSLMLIAISGGAIFAAIYFFIIQSFYKALLFFSSGAMMKATDEETLNEISGLRANKMLFISTLIGVLSLAAFFPLSGFFAAAGTASAFTSNIVIYAIISLVGFGTSFYVFRWFVLLSKPEKSVGIKLRYLGQPKTMVFPVALLAVLTVAASYLFIKIGGILGSGSGLAVYLASSKPLALTIPDSIIITALAIAGACAAYVIYKPSSSKNTSKKRIKIPSIPVYTGRLFSFLYVLASKFLYEIGEGITLFEDYLNGYFDFLGHMMIALSSRVRKFSVGGINPYAFIFAVGLIFMLAYILLVA